MIMPVSAAEAAFELPDFHTALAWGLKHRTYPMTDPHAGPVEYHRLQIEHWLWQHRFLMPPGPMIDIGAEYDHNFWPGLIQLNNHAYVTSSGYSDVQPAVLGDLLSLPFADGSLSAILCMETIEHVRDPFRAVAELYRCLRPGGWLLASTPFFWPEHGGPDYNDYWRITHRGWIELLACAGFEEPGVRILPARIKQDSLLALNVFAQKEVMEIGQVDNEARYTTGYLVRAIR